MIFILMNDIYFFIFNKNNFNFHIFKNLLKILIFSLIKKIKKKLKKNKNIEILKNVPLM